MNPITLFITAILAALSAATASMGYPSTAVLLGIAALLVASSLKMANTWQKFVVLRAGKLHSIQGPLHLGCKAG